MASASEVGTSPNTPPARTPPAPALPPRLPCLGCNALLLGPRLLVPAAWLRPGAADVPAPDGPLAPGQALRVAEGWRCDACGVVVLRKPHGELSLICDPAWAAARPPAQLQYWLGVIGYLSGWVVPGPRPAGPCAACAQAWGGENAGCTANIVSIAGRSLARVPMLNVDRAPTACAVCGARPGTIHHVGCPGEVCPRCGGLYLTCACSGGPRLPSQLGRRRPGPPRVRVADGKAAEDMTP